MIPIIALAFVAVAVLLFLIYQVRLRYLDQRKIKQIGQLLPVDLEAFQNLTDPEEERFLRANLSPKDFRKIRRLRLQAAAMYVSVLSENAGKLLAIGQSARNNPDSAIALSGQEIFHCALRLKLWCVFSLLQINITMIFPTLLSPRHGITERYAHITSLVTSLPRKQAA